MAYKLKLRFNDYNGKETVYRFETYLGIEEFKTEWSYVSLNGNLYERSFSDVAYGSYDFEIHFKETSSWSMQGQIAKNVDYLLDSSSLISSSERGGACMHEWVDVGFHFTKLICKKCNEDYK